MFALDGMINLSLNAARGSCESSSAAYSGDAASSVKTGLDMVVIEGLGSKEIETPEELILVTVTFLGSLSHIYKIITKTTTAFLGFDPARMPFRFRLQIRVSW